MISGIDPSHSVLPGIIVLKCAEFVTKSDGFTRGPLPAMLLRTSVGKKCIMNRKREWNVNRPAPVDFDRFREHCGHHSGQSRRPSPHTRSTDLLAGCTIISWRAFNGSAHNHGLRTTFPIVPRRVSDSNAARTFTSGNSFSARSRIFPSLMKSSSSGTLSATCCGRKLGKLKPMSV